MDVSGYEELIPDFSTPRVLKKDIDEKKEELLKMLAQPEKVEKDSLEKGDFAKLTLRALSTVWRLMVARQRSIS